MKINVQRKPGPVEKVVLELSPEEAHDLKMIAHSTPLSACASAYPIEFHNGINPITYNRSGLLRKLREELPSNR